MSRIRVALLGLAGAGADYLASICSDDRFDLVSIGDSNAERLRVNAESTGARAYEDYRSLIVETARVGLDLLVIALEPFQSVEYAEIAAARGVAVLHKTPWARSLDEARRLIHSFEEHGKSLSVSRWWLHEPAYAGLHSVAERAGVVFAATASVHDGNGSDGWRGDSLRSGGGVLLNATYDIVDMLITTMGAPEQVFARCNMSAEPGAGRPHDTEDFAAVTLQFHQGRTASICATRGWGESAWHLSLHGTRATIGVSPDRLVVTPGDGGQQFAERVWAKFPVSHALSAIADTLQDPDKPDDSAAKDQLITLAVIQAAYLSAKTGESESPMRMLE